MSKYNFEESRREWNNKGFIGYKIKTLVSKKLNRKINKALLSMLTKPIEYNYPISNYARRNKK